MDCKTERQTKTQHLKNRQRECPASNSLTYIGLNCSPPCRVSIEFEEFCINSEIIKQKKKKKSSGKRKCVNAVHHIFIISFYHITVIFDN